MANSKVSLDLDAVILLSLIVTPSVEIALLLTTKPEAALPVNNVAPDTVPVIEVLATETLVVPDEIVVPDIEPNESSTYFFVAASPSAIGDEVVKFLTLDPPISIVPEPAASNIRSSFDLVVVILIYHL